MSEVNKTSCRVHIKTKQKNFTKLERIKHGNCGALPPFSPTTVPACPLSLSFIPICILLNFCVLNTFDLLFFVNPQFVKGYSRVFAHLPWTPSLRKRVV